MSFKLFGLALLGIILYTTAPTQAGVLRSTEKPIDTALPETQTPANDIPESSTIQISRDEDATIKIGEASLDPAPGTFEGIEIKLDTIEGKAEDSKKNEENAEEKPLKEEDEANKDDSNINKNESALSRDEAASIKINAHESDDLAKEMPPSSVEMIHESQKSSKLLLLSTPRLAREQDHEENIEEPEDVDLNTEVSTDETTELSIEVHTEIPKSSEEDDDKSSFITKVRDAIFGKKSAEETPKPTEQQKDEEAKTSDVEKNEEKQGDEEVKDNSDATLPATAEEMPVPHNDNAEAAVLIETEPDYVIFDSDIGHVEHLGSFTHADSDEHLQPIVHSVEVVPSHFEEPLLFTSSYVHAW